MGRILAIDYGTKRTGIAITDELQIIASGLTVITSYSIHYTKLYDAKILPIFYKVIINM